MKLFTYLSHLFIEKSYWAVYVLGTLLGFFTEEVPFEQKLEGWVEFSLSEKE